MTMSSSWHGSGGGGGGGVSGGGSLRFGVPVPPSAARRVDAADERVRILLKHPNERSEKDVRITNMHTHTRTRRVIQRHRSCAT